MRWRPHTERPETAEVFTALLCTVNDDDGEAYLLGGVFNWRNGAWSDEVDDSGPGVERFWWCPESEIMETFTSTLWSRRQHPAKGV